MTTKPIPTELCVNVVQIGDAGHGGYGLHPSFIREGWPWVTRQIDIGIAKGATATVLHCLFGVMPQPEPPGHCMRADMACVLRESRDPVLIKIVDKLFPALWRYTVAGREIIVYPGALQHMQPFAEVATDNAIHYYATAFRPMLEAKCSFAWDASAWEPTFPADGPLWAFAEFIRRRGFRTYCEGWPNASAPHLLAWDGVVCDLANYQTARGSAPRSALKRVIVWITWRNPQPGESNGAFAAYLKAHVASWVDRLLAENCTPAFNMAVYESVMGAALPVPGGVGNGQGQEDQA